MLKKKSFMADLFFEVCEKLNLDLIMGPVYGAYGQIRSLKNDKRISFFNCCFDINGYGSGLTARNKGLTRLILEKNNISMPAGSFFSLRLDDYKHLSLKELNSLILMKAQKITYPVMLKGADLHRGSCVFKIQNDKELLAKLSLVWKKTDGVVLEQYLPYNDYRFIVLDGELIGCYWKKTFQITGDGKKNAKDLIKEAKRNNKKNTVGANFKGMSQEINNKLLINGYSQADIIPDGVSIVLTDTSNISKGGMPVDVTDRISPEMKKYCRKIASILNLRFCGIDILSKNIDLAPLDSFVLEVNSSPDMETYYHLGDKQALVIKKVLKKIIMEAL